VDEVRDLVRSCTVDQPFFDAGIDEDSARSGKRAGAAHIVKQDFSQATEAQRAPAF
jgi:hypothetical protein